MNVELASLPVTVVQRCPYHWNTNKGWCCYTRCETKVFAGYILPVSPWQMLLYNEGMLRNLINAYMISRQALPKLSASWLQWYAWNQAHG